MYRIAHDRNARLAFWAAVAAIAGLGAHLLFFNAEHAVVVEWLACAAVLAALIASFHGEVSTHYLVTVASPGYAVSGWGHNPAHALADLRSRSNFTDQEWAEIEVVALRMHGNGMQVPAVVTLRQTESLVVVARC